jgi:hypothetical protein
MEDLFKWSLITGFVVSLVTFALHFVTRSFALQGIGLKLIIAIVLAIVSIIYFMKKYGVPDSSFTAGGIIGLAAVVGMVSANLLPPVIFWDNLGEYFLTLLLFPIVYLIGGFIGKWAYGGQTGPNRKRRREEEEEKQREEKEPEPIEENEVSGE